MTDEESEPEFPSRFPFKDLGEFNKYRSEKIRVMMENNHRIQMFLRYQVENWEAVAEAWKDQYSHAVDMIEATAVAIRVAVDQTAKLIETEYGIEEIHGDDDEED